MHVCVCFCVLHVCMCVLLRACDHVCVQVHGRGHVCEWVCMCVCVLYVLHVYKCVCMCALYVYACVQVCVCKCAHVCTSVCVHVCAHMCSGVGTKVSFLTEGNRMRSLRFGSEGQARELGLICEDRL